MGRRDAAVLAPGSGVEPVEERREVGALALDVGDLRFSVRFHERGEDATSSDGLQLFGVAHANELRAGLHGFLLKQREVGGPHHAGLVEHQDGLGCEHGAAFAQRQQQARDRARGNAGFASEVLGGSRGLAAPEDREPSLPVGVADRFEHRGLPRARPALDERVASALARDMQGCAPLLLQRHAHPQLGRELGLQPIELGVNQRGRDPVRLVPCARRDALADARLELLRGSRREDFRELLGDAQVNDLVMGEERAKLGQALRRRKPSHAALADQAERFLRSRARLRGHELRKYLGMVDDQRLRRRRLARPHRGDRGRRDTQFARSLLEASEELGQRRLAFAGAAVEGRHLAGRGVVRVQAGKLQPLSDLPASGGKCLALLLADSFDREVGAGGEHVEAQVAQTRCELDAKKDARGQLALELRPMFQGRPLARILPLPHVEHEGVDVELWVQRSACEVGVAGGHCGFGLLLYASRFSVPGDRRVLGEIESGLCRLLQRDQESVARGRVAAREHGGEVLRSGERHVQSHDVPFSCSLHQPFAGDRVKARREPLHVLGLRDVVEAQEGGALARPEGRGTLGLAPRVVVEVSPRAVARLPKIVEVAASARGGIGLSCDLGDGKHGRPPHCLPAWPSFWMTACALQEASLAGSPSASSQSFHKRLAAQLRARTFACPPHARLLSTPPTTQSKAWPAEARA